MNKYKVSVIIPVYNVEEYIKDCLESIKAQTYSNWEVIIVDDGSPDNSGKIADQYSEMDKKFKVIHKENGGVSSARNRGLREAIGEFVLFIDSDDWISKNHIEYLLEMQKKDDADMCISTSLYTKMNEKQSKHISIKTITPDEASALLLSPGMYVGTYGKLYRRSWLIENNIWQNEKIYSGEGLNFTIKAVQYANKITISNKKIYYYRRNVAKSATTKFNLEMFRNNEYSLEIINKEVRWRTEKFDVMWKLFRTHLFISGIVAIETYASREEYPKEYDYWLDTIKRDRRKLVTSKYVPVKSKIRIVGGSYFPKTWAKLATKKRRRIFDKSV
jgi:glycosyltransferase involved in cell wall biosynthesis